MALTVSPGHLDSLTGLVFPVSDYTGLSVQAFTNTSTDLATETLSSITVTDTAAPGPGTAAGETVTVLAVSDLQNTLTLGINLGTTVVQLTEFVIGYSASGILVSGDSSNTIAANLSLHNTVDDALGVISGVPIALGTSLIFSGSGTASIPSPTSVVPTTPTGPITPTLPITPTVPIAPTPPTTPIVPTPGLGVVDTTTKLPVSVAAQAYTGPVAGIQEQFVDVTPDNLNITVTTPNWFIHSGAGTDAIDVSKAGGNNVLDGSTGSNFLTGGSGNDTFFLDDRNPGADVFSTVVGFHSGDNATVFGVNRIDFTLKTLDNQGAAGFTGLDFAFSAPGHPNANFVLAGYTSADLTNGRLTETFGTTPDLPGVPGSQFLLIHAN